MSQTILTLEEQILALKNQIKDLKSKTKKQNGTKVRFKNKEGETIEAYGVLYYYCELNGKTLVKKATLCEVISED